MSDQPRPGGYRGALPPRNDVLAAPWVIAVILIFVLMFVLAFLGFPSGLQPDRTPFPLPSSSPGASVPAASVPAAPSGS
jgi:hypothetical protein